MFDEPRRPIDLHLVRLLILAGVPLPQWLANVGERLVELTLDDPMTSHREKTLALQVLEGIAERTIRTIEAILEEGQP